MNQLTNELILITIFLYMGVKIRSMTFAYLAIIFSIVQREKISILYELAREI